MTPQVEVWEAFALFLVVLSWIPTVRAYAADRVSAWLVAGVTALVVGRAASVLEGFVSPVLLNLVEHGVGVGLVGVCFLGHFHGEWRSSRGDGGVPGAQGGDR